MLNLKSENINLYQIIYKLYINIYYLKSQLTLYIASNFKIFNELPQMNNNESLIIPNLSLLLFKEYIINLFIITILLFFAIIALFFAINS
jgi:hypothetical protein